MPLIPRPPYDVIVENWPTGRKPIKPYRQVRRLQIADFNTDYTVPIGVEWIVRSVLISFNTGAIVGDRYWYFYLKSQDPALGLVAYQRYFNQHAYAVNGIYQDLLGIGLQTNNFQFDTAGVRFGATQGLQEIRLINGDSFYFGFAAHAGDSVQATVLYEEYDEATY